MSEVTTEELRTLFLFEQLSEEQLAWLAARGDIRTFDEGVTVYREGEPAESLYVLLDGGIRMTRLVNGEPLVISDSTQRGVYAGATRAYVHDTDNVELYAGSFQTTQPSRFFRLPAVDFAAFMHTWFPMAVHLLDGLYVGVRDGESTVRQREHLARLGRLSANLAHELNNPAAAAQRASGQLRDRITGMRHKLGRIADGTVDRAALGALIACQEAAVERAAKTRAPLSPVEAADREDAFVDRLDELDLPDGYDLAAVFTAAGLDIEWLDEVVAGLGGGPYEGPLRWLAYTLETEALLDEIDDSTGRISTLVAAVKQYSYLDSPAHQEVDVHPGLDSTLVMLGHKLGRVRVTKEYGQLPEVPAFPGELNQVWTNLIDNAADAMGGDGALTLRTYAEGEEVVVEIADQGPGIPDEVRTRVFDPFFTTKPPGQGSGLGLENARRIVEKRHGGRLTFTTGPTGTTFQVRLPVRR